jgi:hypothetical protein
LRFRTDPTAALAEIGVGLLYGASKSCVVKFATNRAFDLMRRIARRWTQLQSDSAVPIDEVHNTVSPDCQTMKLRSGRLPLSVSMRNTAK